MLGAWARLRGWRPRALSTGCARCAKARSLRKKREMSEKQLTRYFVDHRRVRVVGGQGGGGANSFLSEPRKEFGGPDGGNGGDGGPVILKVDRQVKSLSSILPFYQGVNGVKGGKRNCFGANGGQIYIKVPIGTLVKEDGTVVADLAKHGEEYVAAYGGSGGKGNQFFLSNENRAPTTATPGEPGQQRVLHLELRTMAHAGLVGFPNAGKSSLLRAISNAKPAVASYPFTTLNPHVGIVHYQDYEQVAGMSYKRLYITASLPLFSDLGCAVCMSGEMMCLFRAARNKAAKFMQSAQVQGAGLDDLSRSLQALMSMKSMNVADIPGIIRGAHQNKGLGLTFLKHVERCRFLLFVVDLSVREPWIQVQDLKYELEQYQEGLSKRPHVVIGNKIDLPQSRANLPLLKEQVEQRVIPLSALTGDNLEELFLHLRELYDSYVKTEKSCRQNLMKW